MHMLLKNINVFFQATIKTENRLAFDIEVYRWFYPRFVLSSVRKMKEIIDLSLLCYIYIGINSVLDVLNLWYIIQKTLLLSSFISHLLCTHSDIC